MFSQAFYLVSLTNTALSTITEKVAMVTYSNSKNENEDPKRQVDWISLLSFALSAPIALVLFIYSEEILMFLYGEKWIGASPYLKGLAVFGCLIPIFSNLKTYFWSIRKTLFVGWVYIVALFGVLLLLKFSSIDYVYSLSITAGVLILYFKRLSINAKKVNL